MSDHYAPLLMSWLGLIGIFALIGVAVLLIPYWFIWKKAGFSPWLCLLMVVPLANLAMLYVLAFADWPALPRNAMLPPGLPPGIPPGLPPAQPYR